MGGERETHTRTHIQSIYKVCLGDTRLKVSNVDNSIIVIIIIKESSGMYVIKRIYV